MTCIVGIEHDGGVTMGADSAGSSEWSTSARADTKLFTVGPYMMGFTDSFRMGQLLHYALQPPKPPKKTRDLERHMSTAFVDAVRECLSLGGYQAVEKQVERGGTFLVAVRGVLFTIEGDYQVGREHNRYAAVGCGDHLALGSLHTTASYDMDPEDRALVALEAAAHFSPFVGAPFQVATQTA